jgi:4-amino-4-deoxy-L-arabinose transferase-like glycosyltransferase
MIIALVLSAAVSAALGTLVLHQVWPRDGAPGSRPLVMALGVGIGAGLASLGLFASLVLFGPTRAFPLVEAAVLALLAFAASRSPRAAGLGPGLGEWLAGPARLLTPVFLLALVAAAAAFVTMLRQEPHGGWDAWMNWDMRARMIFLGGPTWRTAFAAELPWSHPDYPVLLPSLVVRAWLYGGKATLLGPALVAATFAFGAVALLVTALAALRAPSQGLLAGMVLLATPFFIRHATSLYADVPLAFFFLATVVCLALDDRAGGATPRFAMLAGFSAGLAMWTKNEGLLFTGCVLAGIVASGRRAGWPVTRRRLLNLGAGLLLPLLVVVSFKLTLAPPNDLLSTLGVERTLGRLTDWSRYATVLRAYAVHLATFGANGLPGAVWPLAVFAVALGWNAIERRRPWAGAVTIALGLLLAGHFMVFVSMADELARLLASSLDRLILQLWPGTLFLIFMVARTLEEVGGREPTLSPRIPEVATR